MSDLRKLNQATLDVHLKPFSIWCWEGECQRFPNVESGCAPLIFCECSCHKMVSS